MEKTCKAETFIGFAVRARKISFGANTLSTLKKACLILVCETASDNTVKIAERYALKYRCGLLRTKNRTLCDLAHKDGVKIAALTDSALAEALINFGAPELVPVF